MKFPDFALVVKITDGLVIAFPHFNEIGRKLSALGIALREKILEVAPVPAN